MNYSRVLLLLSIVSITACHKTANTITPGTKTTIDSPKKAAVPVQLPSYPFTQKYTGTLSTASWTILPQTDTVNTQRSSDTLTIYVTYLNSSVVVFRSATSLPLKLQPVFINDTFSITPIGLLAGYITDSCTLGVGGGTCSLTWDNVISNYLGFSDLHGESYGQYTGYLK